MREKIKSYKIGVILTIYMLVIFAISIYVFINNKSSINTNDIEDKVITKINSSADDYEKENLEDKGEESTTEEIKTEVSNTPKNEEKKKISDNQTTTNNDEMKEQTSITKQEIVENDNSTSSSSSNNEVQTNIETTDFYNSITHGQWETDINDSESLCEAKGVRIAINELNEILDWNELHEEDQKQPIINYSRCYPVIKDGVKHWYLHFFTTKGESMDTEIKNKYNF